MKPEQEQIEERIIKLNSNNSINKMKDMKKLKELQPFIHEQA